MFGFFLQTEMVPSYGEANDGTLPEACSDSRLISKLQPAKSAVLVVSE